MSNIEKLLEFNEKFVREKQYVSYEAIKYPDMKIAILSCMDTRLTELLHASMNTKNGDVLIVKNAGAVISHPFGSIMRSLLIAVYDLGVEEIMVIAHNDCGMQQMEASGFTQKMLDRNISKDTLDVVNHCGADLTKWLEGFQNTGESVSRTVDAIKNHPLMPGDVNVYGFVMDSKTGKLSRVV